MKIGRMHLAKMNSKLAENKVNPRFSRAFAAKFLICVDLRKSAVREFCQLLAAYKELR